MEESEVSTDGEELESANSVSPLEWLQFVTHAAKRHRWLGIVLGAVIAIVGTTLGLIIPAKYDAEVRILFLQSASVAAALSSPNSQQRQNTATPIAESTELLVGKPSLLKVVEEADLLTHFRQHRSFPLRMKDAFFALIFEPLSDSKMKIMLAETLQTRMWVSVKDSLITIHVMWSDPDMTLRLATLLQKRLLDMRKEQELGGINVAIAINEEELRNASQGIDAALREVEQSRARTLPRAVAPAASPDNKAGEASRRFVSRSLSVSSEDTAAENKRLLGRLAETRQKSQQIEESWQRRVIDLKFQLNDLRTTYGPEHPTMIQQQARIREASIPPPELTQLREQERQLLAQIENASALQEAERSKRAKELGTTMPRAFNDSVASAQDRRDSFPGASTVVITEREEDPRIAPAKANLSAAIRRYTDVTQRLDAARIELTASQVALKYRYAVVAEPERPRKPSKPNRPIIIVGALLGACLVGFLAGAIRDLLSNRVYEPFQLKTVGLDVVGEVRIRMS